MVRRAWLSVWTAALAVVFAHGASNTQLAHAGPVQQRGKVWSHATASSRRFAGPTYVAVDPRGDAYIANTGAARIEEVSSGGRLVPTWARHARRAHLITPLGIALDGKGDVYGVDAGRRAIDEFSSEGQVLAVRTLRAAHVRGPGGLALDPHGNLLVVDQLADQIVKLSPRGQVLAHWGSKGSGRSQFLNPHGIAVDRHGNVYVADYSNLRIVKLSSAGKVLALIGVGSFDEDEPPQGVAVTMQGDLYTGAGAVLEFAPNGRLLRKWKTYGRHHNSLAGAFGVAVDVHDNVYVIDQRSTALVKLSPIGQTLAVWR